MAATRVLSFLLLLSLMLLCSAPNGTPVVSVYPALLTAAASAGLVASLFARTARQVLWLPVAYILGLAAVVVKADPTLLPVVGAAEVAALLPLGLRLLQGPPAAKETGPASPVNTSAIYEGATAFSVWKGLAFLTTFVFGCLLETSGCWHFAAGDRLLQPVWDFLLRVGWPYVTHAHFAGFVATAAYFVVCFYFSILDLTKSDTKVQTDYWPTLKCPPVLCIVSDHDLKEFRFVAVT